MNNLISANGTLTKYALNKFLKNNKKLKEANQEFAELKEQMLKEMEERGLLKIVTDEATISYVEKTTRESLDTKALREELPDIYDAYVKMTEVKASVRVNFKKSKE